MTVGDQVSHYRIVEKLGEGGMGVVYRAEDQKLRRTVALKFLPPQQGVSDADKERFLREAQAAAALDHANICTVYEIDEAEGRLFMAMAFVEGTALDERIAEGPLPLPEALEIARQAAEGLQEAHKKGIVHRDIKSSNLMIAAGSSKPRVKVLDFGLAQLSGRSKITQTETRMGTVAYMSPEQTQGEPVDQRTDIWSLGVVLYEMISGELPFKGHYDQATLYSILNEDPTPLTALRSRIPVELDWIIDKCLAKSPDERYQTVDDLLLDLTTLQKKLSSQRLSIHRTQIESPSTSPPTAPAPAAIASKVRKLWWAVGLLAALAAGEFIWALYRRAEPPAAVATTPVRRFDITLPRSLPEGVQLRQLAISPDGRRVAFVTTEDEGRLWARDLSQPVAWPLEGTEGALGFFWSPDSAWIGYFVRGELRKVAAQGGPSSVLTAPLGDLFAGGGWNPDGSSIYFASGPPFGLYEVSSLGGAPKQVLQPGRGRYGGLPTELQALADSSGETLLLGSIRTPSGEQIGLFDPKTAEVELFGPGSSPFYSSAGYLLYQPSRNGGIWAAPYSIDKRRPTGDAFPVAQDGRRPSASDDGTLVYIDDSLSSAPRRVVLRDRSGEIVGELGSPQVGVRSPRISPDGSRVAVSAMDSGGEGVWLHGEDGEANQRLSESDSNDGAPIWSPDGGSVAYPSNEGGVGSVWLRESSGRGQAREIFSAPGNHAPIDWSADGDTILLRTRAAGSGGISYLRRNTAGGFDLHPFLEGAFGANEASLSPEGRYVVYSVREGGEFRIVAQAFPEQNEPPIVVAAGQVGSPRWSRAGDEIFYVQGETLTAVPVETDGGLELGDPQELFSHPALNAGRRGSAYDVSADGSRIAIVEIVGQPPLPTIRVVLNWLAEFQR